MYEDAEPPVIVAVPRDKWLLPKINLPFVSVRLLETFAAEVKVTPVLELLITNVPNAVSPLNVCAIEPLRVTILLLFTKVPLLVKLPPTFKFPPAADDNVKLVPELMVKSPAILNEFEVEPKLIEPEPSFASQKVLPTEISPLKLIAPVCDGQAH
jgi:hypothetical protein